MKKNTWIMVLVVLLAGASLVYAEGMKGVMMKEGMMGKGMMDGEMMGCKMMGMCPMMNSMMERSVVVTSDGGVIVVMGNKLTKYDKDLNVVKEVELKTDMEGMQKMMENMKVTCPMMKSMMEKEEKSSDDSADK
jgi:hypothetical protein